MCTSTTFFREAKYRARKCSPTAFYDILGIESEKSTVTDSGIKKAYRKLSLLTHPDKNGYDGADEAFKSMFTCAHCWKLGFDEANRLNSGVKGVSNPVRSR